MHPALRKGSLFTKKHFPLFLPKNTPPHFVSCLQACKICKTCTKFAVDRCTKLRLLFLDVEPKDNSCRVLVACPLHCIVDAFVEIVVKSDSSTTRRQCLQ